MYALHPITNKKIPIWISDYVLIDYGTGAIMAVPCGDQRDWSFANKFDLENIKTTLKDKKQVLLFLSFYKRIRGLSNSTITPQQFYTPEPLGKRINHTT